MRFTVITVQRYNKLQSWGAGVWVWARVDALKEVDGDEVGLATANRSLAQVLNLPVAFGANDFGVSRKDFCVVDECSCHTERVAECHFVGCFNLCG